MTMGVVQVLNKLLSEKGFFFTAVETMRASVVLLFPFLALAFVAAYAAAELIVYANNLVISLRMSFNMLSQRERSLVFDK